MVFSKQEIKQKGLLNLKAPGCFRDLFRNTMTALFQIRGDVPVAKLQLNIASISILLAVRGLKGREV